MINSWIDKKRHSINQWVYSRAQIFKESERVKVELDLSNYVKKKKILKMQYIIQNTSSFAKNVDLANLNSKVDKLDMDKL